MRRRRSSEFGGSTLLEFVLIGVPVIFVIFSTAEVARAMWSYHTLAYSVREGTRYAIVHGADCTSSPNSCSVTIANIAGKIKAAGIGLNASQLTLTFTPNTGTATSCSLSNCLTNNTTWPPSTANSTGMSVSISGIYQFNSVIAMFWPGTSGFIGNPSLTFSSYSRDTIQF